MKKPFKALAKLFDERDLFVLAGMALLFEGLHRRFGLDIAMIALGAIILLKGLTRWV